MNAIASLKAVRDEWQWSDGMIPVAVQLVDAVLKETAEAPAARTFEAELTELINRHSLENESDTPDFVLADYMRDCLTAYRRAVTRRDDWFDARTKDAGEKPIVTDALQELYDRGLIAVSYDVGGTPRYAARIVEAEGATVVLPDKAEVVLSRKEVDGMIVTEVRAPAQMMKLQCAGCGAVIERSSPVMVPAYCLACEELKAVDRALREG